MKLFVPVLALAGVALLPGCNVANNTLASLSGSSIPAACVIIGVAEGYFANVKFKVTPPEALAEKDAQAIVSSICANPPSNLTVAFQDLLSAWTVIQAATTVPSPTNLIPFVPALVAPAP
jgi:hypothetical protein